MFPFDAPLAAFLASDRSDAMIGFFTTITKAGDLLVVLTLAALMSIVFLRTHHPRYVFAFLVVALGSALTNGVLKVLFALPRPTDPIALVTIDSFSFPSGHSAVSFAVYGFLIFLALHRKASTTQKAAAAFLAVLILLIGFSRLYLGVHYLSDVLGGFLVGALWLYVGIRIASSEVLKR